MNHEPDSELEARLDRELKKLPPITAPATLIPNVFARLEARGASSWWQRAWWDWPLAAKAAFLLLALGLVAVVSTGTVWLDHSVSDYSRQWTERLSPLAGAFDSLAPLATEGLHSWQQAAQPLLLYGLILAGALYLVCVGVGTMFFRIALKRV